jgi:hypothetical protein
MALSEALLLEFDQEMANTWRTLERVPGDKFDWKPHPKSWNLGELATFLAILPGWGATTIAQDSLDLLGPAPPHPVNGEGTGTALRQECGRRPWGHRRSQRSTSHEPLDVAERRQNTILAAANCRTAKLCHESHDPPSRSTHSVSSDERRACAGHLRTHGRRGGMVGEIREACCQSIQSCRIIGRVPASSLPADSLEPDCQPHLTVVLIG